MGTEIVCPVPRFPKFCFLSNIEEGQVLSILDSSCSQYYYYFQDKKSINYLLITSKEITFLL